MKKITTCTPDSETQMNLAISAGLKYELNFESLEANCGLSVFAETIQELRIAFNSLKANFEMWKVSEYTENVRSEREIKRGWL